MGRQALIWTAVLLPISLLPAVTGLVSRSYFWAALIAGGLLLGFATDFAVERGQASARRLFFATLAYLPVLFGALVAFKPDLD